MSEPEPFVAVLDGQPIDLPDTRYPASRLFPPAFSPSDRARTWVVLPLAFESQRLGIAMFELHAGYSAYQMLCDQISAMLRNAELHHEIVSQTLLHERVAATKRMQSLSVLAGGVAHDLNNALGPLVALPEVILSELARPDVGEPGTLATVRAEVESIRAASIRATQTIKDLLTLGRQGRTAKQPLDINRVAIACLDGEPRLRDAGGRIRVAVELCREPLMVMASEPQLGRAFGNLLRNAAEAIVSGHASTERADFAIVRGVPWLAKPYTPETLRRAVRASLSQPSRPRSVACELGNG